MTEQDWLKQYDESQAEFRWFIVKYFKTSVWADLVLLREKAQAHKMATLLGNIWFELPDNKFNIMENPKGWNEFLGLIDDPIDDEQHHDEDPPEVQYE
jgi:hypothetical protein